MKLLYQLLIILITALVTLGGCRQQPENNRIQGLWLIADVQVGDQQMTPVAKWTRINRDGSFESGNGWMQNSSGTWSYDEAENTYAPNDPLGVEDPFGPFSVDVENETMTWQREEEGMTVTVRLERIEELPKAPADKIQGLWDLQTVTHNGEDITGTYDPEGERYLFIRWDRIYIERNEKGDRTSGYWHMDGHQPRVTLLPHSEGQEPQSWQMEADSDELTLSGASDTNDGHTMIFSRISKFPD